MHHRVRRSFNEVVGFLTREEAYAEGQDVSHAFDALRERIQAMALVHSILYKTGRESEVEMGLYLTELREAMLQAHGSAEQIAIEFAAPGIILKDKQATSCGLIITELVSNSLLHAFPREVSLQRKGQISVSLSSHARVLQLEVSDNGTGMPRTSEELKEGMGLSLVRSLISDDLKGTMRVTSDESGTRYTIEFPHT